MSKFNWKSLCILSLPVIGIFLSVACDSKRTDEKRSLIILDEVEEDSDQPLESSFINKNGKIDIAGLSKAYTEEARENWDSAGTQGPYLRINKNLKKVRVVSGDSEGTYKVVTSECSFEGFFNDNSQTKKWQVGSSSECSDLLARSEKHGDLYLIQLRGFEGTYKILRAMVIERHYVAQNVVSEKSIFDIIGKMLDGSEFTVRAAKIFLPPQIEANENRGFEMEHEWFALALSQFDQSMDELVPLSDSVEVSTVNAEAIDENVTAIKGEFGQLKINSPEEAFELLALGQQVPVILRFETGWWWKKSFNDFEVTLDPVETVEGD